MDEPIAVGEGDLLGGQKWIFSEEVQPSWLGEGLELWNILACNFFVDPKHVKHFVSAW